MSAPTTDLPGSSVPLRTSGARVLVATATVGLLVVVVVGISGAGSARTWAVACGGPIVAAAFLLARPWRELVAVVGVVGWAAWVWAETHAPATVVVQASGAAVLAVTSWWAARVAARAVAWDRRAAASAGERSAQLATVLRLRSLDPEAIPGVLAEGVHELGFASVVVRVPDAEGGLVLREVRPADGERPPQRTAPGEGLAGAVVTARRAMVEGTGARAGRAIAAPVLADGALAGVVEARRPGGPLEVEERAGVALLAEEAGRSLARARRYAEEAAAIAELRRLDRVVQDVVATVSHELRTPTTVVAGLARTVSRRWEDLDEGRREDLLQRIDQNVERLARMLGSLMDSSALERGELVAAPRPVVLADHLAAVRRRRGGAAPEPPLVLEVPASLVVSADPDLLAHVWENLLSNVARHTPPGTTVTVHAVADEQGVRVEVADDGHGIPETALPHVRERFYRVDEASGGLGLGLALVDQILVAHGTRLTVTNRPSGGASFRFRLPAPPRDLPGSSRPDV